MDDTWFYCRQGRRPVGPVTWDEMRRLVESRQIQLDDLVRPSGTPRWRQAGEVAGRGDEARHDTGDGSSRHDVRPWESQSHVGAVEAILLDTEAIEFPRGATSHTEKSHAGEEGRLGVWLLRAVWTALTALPLLSGGVWLVLAVVRRRRLHLIHAVQYVFWPFLTLWCQGVSLGLSYAVLESGESVGFRSTLALGDSWFGVAMTVGLVITWLASLVNAQLQWPEALLALGPLIGVRPAPRMPGHGATSSYVRCFLLWITLGWLGAHRFYAGRWVTGWLYVCTFGFGGIGWAADAFFLSGMAERAIRFQVPDFELAPWAREGRRWLIFDYLLGVVFFFVAPLFFVALMVLLKHFELLAVMFLTLIACGLLGNVQKAAQRFGVVEKLPILGRAFGFVKALHAFYFAHRPRPFLFYLCYPITCPVACLLGRTPRVEAILYLRFLWAVLMVIFVQQSMSYGNTYPPHLGLGSAGSMLAMQAFLATAATMFLLVPMITTSFALNLSGEQPRVKFLTIMVLCLSLPIGAFTYFGDNFGDQAPMVAGIMLDYRLASPSFREELRAEAEMFLAYHVEAAQHAARSEHLDGLFPLSASFHDDGSQVPISESSEAPEEELELTRKFRRHVAGILGAGESRAFRVVRIADPAAGDEGGRDERGLDEGGRDEQVWLGVELHSLSTKRLLCLIGPRGSQGGEFFTRWNELPVPIRRRLNTADLSPALRQFAPLMARRQLLDDSVRH